MQQACRNSYDEVRIGPYFVAAHFVCFCHLADIQLTRRNVRFWGVKRTSQIRPVMSAFDPKRTLGDLEVTIPGLFRCASLFRYDALSWHLGRQ